MTGAHHRAVEKLLFRLEKFLELVFFGQVGAELGPAQIGRDLLAQLNLGELHFLQHLGEFLVLFLQLARTSSSFASMSFFSTAYCGSRRTY